MKKKDKFDKYNFSNNTKKASIINNKIGIIETLKKWIIQIYNYFIYQWTHNRMIFLLVLSMLFLLCYYIYIHYIYKEDENDNKTNNNELLNEIVKTKANLKSKRSQKRIPKKHETRCRIIMENLFKSPFISVRPDFLKYDKTGKNLELDVYNADLNLALEYDGVHHRKFTEFFHKSEQDFIDQQDRDRYKEERE